MNNSIYAMNHSAKTQEPESGKLPYERDINRIYAALRVAVGDENALSLCCNMGGMDYGAKCAMMLEQIAIACDGDEQTKTAAGIAEIIEQQAREDDDRDLHRTQEDARF